jgi:uncharacterized membrane protein
MAQAQVAPSLGGAPAECQAVEAEEPATAVEMCSRTVKLSGWPQAVVDRLRGEPECLGDIVGRGSFLARVARHELEATHGWPGLGSRASAGISRLSRGIWRSTTVSIHHRKGLGSMRCAAVEPCARGDAVKRYEQQITIQVPTLTVFDYVSDFTRHGDWAGHGLEVTRDGDGQVQVGSTFSTVAKQFGTQREHSTITELQPNSTFGWDSRGSLGVVHHRFSIADAEGGSSVTKSAELTEPSFLAKMMGWKLSKDIPADLHSDLEKIKAHLETVAAG